MTAYERLSTLFVLVYWLVKVDKIMQSLGHSHLLLHKTQSYAEPVCA